MRRLATLGKRFRSLDDRFASEFAERLDGCSEIVDLDISEEVDERSQIAAVGSHQGIKVSITMFFISNY